MQTPFFTTQHSKKRGLTLVEMLVALVIFSISFVALMTVTSRGVASTTSIESELITQYLALESIELVRNIRDSNYIKNVDTAGESALEWLNGVEDECKVSSLDDPGCYAKIPLDMSSGGRFIDCVGAACPFIQYIDSYDLYYQNTALPLESIDTQYARGIQLYQQAGDDGYNVRVNVTWQDRTRTQLRTYDAYITDWQQPLFTP